MTARDAETRRATGSWRLLDATGMATSGEGQLAVTDDGLEFGGHGVAFLDADAFSARDRSIELDLHPTGRLTLSMLGRRFDTFAVALQEARLARRVAGMLAHGIDAPMRYRGAIVDTAAAPAELFLFPTHLTIAPDERDPWQIPLGAIRAVRHIEESWSVEVEAWDSVAHFGQLARMTGNFASSLSDAVAKSRASLGAAGESPRFADGAGVPVSQLASFTRLVERWAAPERLEGVNTIVAQARGVRLGLVKLVDTDDQLLAAREPLPDHVAAFILAPVGPRVILEVISGPSAATWVFEGDIEAINHDLQALHFRRRPLTLSDAELLSPTSDYRLAGRRLEPLKRLRAAKRERISHDGMWKERLAAIL